MRHKAIGFLHRKKGNIDRLARIYIYIDNIKPLMRL